MALATIPLCCSVHPGSGSPDCHVRHLLPTHLCGEERESSPEQRIVSLALRMGRVKSSLTYHCLRRYHGRVNLEATPSTSVLPGMYPAPRCFDGC